MKMLTVSLLVCALMALAAANDVSTNDKVEPSQAPEATHAADGTEEPAPAVNWFPFQCRLYGFVETPMTWVAAEKHCQTMGANLASVHNDDEQQYLLQFIHQNNTQEAWLGGTDCQEDGQWLWTDGRTFGYSVHCDKPGFTLPFKNCLQMSYVDRCWEDKVCFATRPFVCAKPLPCCTASLCPLPTPSDQ